MTFWGKRKKSAKSQGVALNFEKLESRELLAVIPILSGQTTSFRDADGTMVRVKLTGPGQGSLELTNGQSTLGSIESLALVGTTGESRLKISAKGGGISGTTIHELVIDNAINQLGALRQLHAPKVSIAAGGQMLADGDIAEIKLRDLADGAEIHITGNVGQFKARTLHNDSSVEVTGVLTRFVADTLFGGAEVAANQLDQLKVTNRVQGATFDVGAGGIRDVNIKHIRDSVIVSDGNIGRATFKGDMIATSLVSNISAGSDGEYGTIDDFVTNPSATGAIGFVKMRGMIGTNGFESNVIASDDIGPVELGRSARQQNAQPVLWEQAASQFVPLAIQQPAGATGFGDNQIWIAVFGQEIPAPPPGDPPTSGKSYYLRATDLDPQQKPLLNITTSLLVGPDTPDSATLPSSTIQQWKNAQTTWGSNLSFPVPKPGNQFTGRILISAGVPVQAQVNATDGTVSAPSASNPTDPSNGTFYDFLEFTVTNTGGTPSLDIDTSQVDSFGLPMKLQFYKDAAATMEYHIPFTGNTSLGSKTISGINSTTGLGQGQPVFGAGIPYGATIQTIVPPTTNSGGMSNNNGMITLNQVASATAMGVSLTAYAGGPVGVDTPRDQILAGTTDAALLHFIRQKVNNGSEEALPFLQSAVPYAKAGPIPITGTSFPTGNPTGPVVIMTDSAGALQNGDVVSVSGVGGTTAANGVFTVANVTAQSFELVGTTYDAAYTSGGTWSMAITGASSPAPTDPIVIDTSYTGDLEDGDLVEISGVEGNSAANGFHFVTDVTNTSFKLVGSTSTGTYTQGGTWKVYTTSGRLISPKDLVEGLANPNDPGQLNNYYNQVIDEFFLRYLPSSQSVNGHTGGGHTLQLVSSASTSSLTYSGTVTNSGTYNNSYVLRLSADSGVTNYDVYYPFLTTNTPDGYTPYFTPVAPPPWLNAGQKLESASRMIFACDALFADNVPRKKYDMTAATAPILADLENSISAAFNRGVALEQGSDWGDTSKWFQNDTYNYWVEYWHQGGLNFNDLAYAFPYDDKFGASTNINLANVGLALVTLGHWSGSSTPTSVTFEAFPTEADQGGEVMLTARVTGTGPAPTGTITFFIDGVPINANDYSSSPPQQPRRIDANGRASLTANLPALSSGNLSHTFTVTAVYSGDSQHLPSVSFDYLKLEGPNGDFPLSLSSSSGARGSTTTATVTLPGEHFDGTLQFGISHSDGTGQQNLGSSINVTTSTVVSPSLTIPTNLLTFTGDMDSSSSTISNISSVVDVLPGQTLTSSIGFSATAEIDGVTPAQFTLSHPALKTGLYTLTSNGVTFAAVLTENETLVKGVNSLAGLQNNGAISGESIQSGTTISNFIYPSITLKNGVTPNSTATGASITSNGAGAVFSITADFAPTVGGPYSANTPFTVTG